MMLTRGPSVLSRGGRRSTESVRPILTNVLHCLLNRCVEAKFRAPRQLTQGAISVWILIIGLLEQWTPKNFRIHKVNFAGASGDY